MSNPPLSEEALFAALTAVTKENPAAKLAPYPAALPLELALNTSPLANVLSAYELTPVQFKDILANPSFRKEYDQYQEELKTEGFSFRQKAKSQAEAYLQVAWELATDPATPAAVRADLIKQTVKWSRLDPSATGYVGAVSNQQQVADIVQSLRDIPDSELEIQVLNIVSRRSNTPAPSYIDMEVAKLDTGSNIEDVKPL